VSLHKNSEDSGWVWGETLGGSGWFPPAFFEHVPDASRSNAGSLRGGSTDTLSNRMTSGRVSSGPETRRNASHDNPEEVTDSRNAAELLLQLRVRECSADGKLRSAVHVLASFLPSAEVMSRN